VSVSNSEFGEYQVADLIGEGGAARVYRAVRLESGSTQREVALKRFHSHVSADANLLGQLQEGARLWSDLHHPNVVEVFDFGMVQEFFCIAIELVEGYTLRQVLQKVALHGPFPPAIAMEFCLEICKGLSYVHGLSVDTDGDGVVHRGLHPGNVLVSGEGLVKVTDFGVARAEAALTRALAAQVNTGIPFYLSPEQVNRQRLDQRSDLFSLGTMMSEVIIGRYPFRGTSADEVLRGITKGDVGALLEEIGEIVPAMVPVLKRAFQRRPDDRYPSAVQMTREVAEIYVSMERSLPLADWLGDWMTRKRPRTITADIPVADKAKKPVRRRRGGLQGKTIADKYLVGSRIGRGGMGEVYKARHEQLSRDVVVKILKPLPDTGMDRRWFEKMFLREAAAAASLKNPHTITIYDFGRTRDGILYIVMEYLHGKTIQQEVLKDGAFKAVRGVHVGIQVCRSLHEAHERGIVHRDLKPSNVMLVERNNDPDFAKVLDFGLVKQAQQGGEASELTLSGKAVGSPKYAAPEQLLSRADVDRRADVYAFGLLLYYMFAGQAPFTGDIRQIITAQLMDPPPPIEEINPDADLPSSLVQVIYGCLEKEPEWRFPSMRDVAQALKGVDLGMGGISIAGFESGDGSWDNPPRKSTTRPPTPIPDDEDDSEDEETIEDEVNIASMGDRVSRSDSADGEPAVASAEDPTISRETSVSLPRKRPLGLFVAAAVAVVVVVAILGLAGAYFGGLLGGGAEDEEIPVTEDATVAPDGDQDALVMGSSGALIEDAVPTMVLLAVSSSPSGASVSFMRDGEEQRLGSTPLDVELEVSGEYATQDLVLVFRKRGYRDRTVQKPVGDGIVTASVKLDALPKETPTQAVGDWKDDPY